MKWCRTHRRCSDVSEACSSPVTTVVRSGAVGAILRDSTGAFLAVGCSFKQFALDVPSMEALALLLGLRIAEELGMHSVAIESDSLEIVQAILNPSEYRASKAVVTDDCRKMMSSFGRAMINHYALEANVALMNLLTLVLLRGVRKCGSIILLVF